MKTLKKILSVVLVVAMLASMCIVGAAAAETEKTNYEEAVAVVTGVGIIEGDENGMNYQGNVTRAQAAKIIAYLLLGKDTAEALKTSAAPFADVAANHWAAGFIAYLKGQGIISGVSDTEFDPNGDVTGIAFAKMLLTAAGYGANGEFEGKDWEINTITFANENGIYEGTLTETPADPATREEAMLYAFNLLTKVPVVKWNSTFESYYTGTSALKPITGAVNPADATINADDAYYYTLGYSKYELKQVASGNVDAFGRPAATWTADSLYVADAIANIEADAVIPMFIYTSDIYATAGKTVMEKVNAKFSATQTIPAVADDPSTPAVDETTPEKKYRTNSFIEFYIDGVLQTNYQWEDTLMYAGEKTNRIGGVGATNEIYVSDADANGDYTITIVQWSEHMAEVKSVATVGDVTTLTLAPVAGGPNVTVTSDDLDVSGYAKKDMVVYTKGKTAGGKTVVASLSPANTVIATYDSYVPDYYAYMMSGAMMFVSGAAGMNPYVVLGGNYGNTYELYLDNQGYIHHVELYEEGESANQYLYVNLAEAQPYVEGNLKGQAAKVALTVVYPTGGKEVLYYNVKYSASTDTHYITINDVDYAIVNTGSADAPAVGFETIETTPVSKTLDEILGIGWYRYTTNDAGEVTLKALNTNYADEKVITLDTGRATVLGSLTYGKTADSKTTLTLVDATGTAVTYTGYNNFIDVDNLTALVTYGYQGKNAKSITIYVDSITGTPNLAYCAGILGTSADGTTYMFYVDGVAQYVVTEQATIGMTPIAKKNVYTLNVVDGEYVIGSVGTYTMGTNDENNVYNEKGVVNAADFDVYNSRLGIYEYKEYATIDTIDDNYFTTVEVLAADAGDSVAGATESYTYYYDANTKVYDVTGMGATEISEGDVFVAYVDETASAAYLGAAYASVIWIVA